MMRPDQGSGTGIDSAFSIGRLDSTDRSPRIVAVFKNITRVRAAVLSGIAGLASSETVEGVIAGRCLIERHLISRVEGELSISREAGRTRICVQRSVCLHRYRDYFDPCRLSDVGGRHRLGQGEEIMETALCENGCCLVGR